MNPSYPLVYFCSFVALTKFSDGKPEENESAAGKSGIVNDMSKVLKTSMSMIETSVEVNQLKTSSRIFFESYCENVYTAREAEKLLAIEENEFQCQKIEERTLFNKWRIPMMCITMCTDIALHLTFIFVLLTNTEVYSLFLKEIIVPSPKLLGEEALLRCDYELEGDKLYAVKWYKENEEFYRYVPKTRPSQISYKVEGIIVDESNSNDSAVSLRKVNLKTTGIYRCEVSIEGPPFKSSVKERYLQVVVVDEDGPYISGQRKEYRIGDELVLNCSSGASFPAPELKWYINELEASNVDLKSYPAVNNSEGLITVVLGLRLTLVAEHFPENGDDLRVRCQSILSFWHNNKDQVLNSIKFREAMLLVKSKGVSETFQAHVSIPCWILSSMLVLQKLR